ncbi:MAG: hypothetical protein M3Q79_01710 [bacterium]|nr:hypothetical protein [bacterium]
MINAFLALVPLGLVGLASEAFWRAEVLRGEGGRKFIHILSGIWIALWPLFLPMNHIALLSAGLLFGLIISRVLHIFHAVYDVKRRTYGEYLYPLAIFLCALLAQSRWHFAAAVLILAVADGMAAVIGTRYEKQTKIYYVWSAKKTILGTATHLICSIIIFLVVGRIYAQIMPFAAILLISLFATLSENLLPYGIDNLAIPLFIVILLPVVV